MSPSPRRLPKSALSALRSACSSTVVAATISSMLLLPALPLTASALEGRTRWPATFEALGKFGNRRIIGEGRAFVPVWQNSSNLVFLDLRGWGDSEQNTEGNFGAAYRHLFDSWILGAYGFFDYRSSDFGNNSWIGGTVGVEALTHDWDFHANGYFPETGSKSAPNFDRTVATFPNIAVQRGREEALWGMDSEIGWRLPISTETIFWDTRFYAGGYYFDSSGVKAIAGPRGRLEMRLHNPFPFLPRGSRITLGIEGQWDHVRDGQVYGSVALRVPIYKYDGEPPDASTPESRLSMRMMDPIQRDVDVVVNVKGGRLDPVYNEKTGEQIEFLYYADAQTGGSGRLNDPAEIQQAIDLASDEGTANGIVVAVGRTGTIDTFETEFGSAFLEDNLILMGGGATIWVEDAAGRKFGFTADGRPAFLTHSDGGDIITAARNNLVAGLNFNGGGTAIRADDPGDFMVVDSNFTLQEDYGILAGFGKSDDWWGGIMRNHFTGNFRAIDMLAGAQQVTIDISDNVFTADGAPYFDFDGTAINITSLGGMVDVGIEDNTIDDYGLVDFFGDAASNARGSEGDGLFGSPAVLVTGGAQDLAVAIAGNRIVSDGPETPGGTAVAVSIGSADNATVTVDQNTIDGFLGARLEKGASAVVQVEGFADAFNTFVTNNDITAPVTQAPEEPSIEGESVQLGGRAILVNPFGGDVNATVSGNDVMGYAGLPFEPDASSAAVSILANSTGTASVIANDNNIDAAEDQDFVPNWFGLSVGVLAADDVDVTADGNTLLDYLGYLGYNDAALDVEVDTLAKAVVLVRDNDVQAPVVDGTAVGAAGVAVDVISNAGISSTGVSGPGIVVSGNDVNGYRGSGLNPCAQGAVSVVATTIDVGAAVNVTVDDNTVTSPGLDPENDQDLSGPGISVVTATNPGNATFTDIFVTNNDVDGYTGTAEVAAVEVSASGNDVEVTVGGDGNGNTVTAPQQGGYTGIDVDVVGFLNDVAVDDNEVIGYARRVSNENEAEKSGEGQERFAAIRVNASADFVGTVAAESKVSVSGNMVSEPGDDGDTAIEVTNLGDLLATTNIVGNEVSGYDRGIHAESGVFDTVAGAPLSNSIVNVFGNDLTGTGDPSSIGIDVDNTGLDRADTNVGSTDPGQGNDVNGYALGIDVDATPIRLSNVHVSGNSLGADEAGLGTGIDVFSTSVTNVVTLDGNDVDGFGGEGQGGAGILVDVAGVSVFASSEVTLTDNTVTAAEGGGADGIAVTSTARLGTLSVGLAGRGNAVNGYEEGISVDAAHRNVTVSVQDNLVEVDGSELSGIRIDTASPLVGVGVHGVAAVGNEVNGYQGSGDPVGAIHVGVGPAGFATVGVTENTVSAPSGGGYTGIDVDVSSNDAQVNVDDDSVEGYGLRPELEGLGAKAPEGVLGVAAVDVLVATGGAGGSTSNVSVSGNDVSAPSEGGGIGILVDHSGFSTNTDVDDNVSVDGYDNGIRATVVAGAGANVSASGNEVDGTGENAGDGMSVDVESGGAAIEIVDNTVANSGNDGIALRTSNGMDGVDTATVTGNDVENSGSFGITLREDDVADGELDVRSELDNSNILSNPATVADDGNVTGFIRVNDQNIFLPQP